MQEDRRFMGWVANLIGVVLLRGARSLNVRSAYLHVLSDALASLAVIIGGVIMWLTQGAYVLDAVLACLIALLIRCRHTGCCVTPSTCCWRRCPRGSIRRACATDIHGVPGVREVHDIHIWTITSGVISLSAHIVVDAPEGAPCSMHDALIQNVQRLLEKKHKILHSTLQVESAGHEHVSDIH